MLICEFNNHAEVYHFYIENQSQDILCHLAAFCACGKETREGSTIPPWWIMSRLVRDPQTYYFLLSFTSAGLHEYFKLSLEGYANL